METVPNRRAYTDRPVPISAIIPSFRDSSEADDIQHWADRFLAALERQPRALSHLEKMPSAES